MKRILILLGFAFIGLAVYAHSQNFKVLSSMNEVEITAVHLVDGKLYVDYRQEPSFHVLPNSDSINNPTVFRKIYVAKDGKIVLELIVDGIYHPKKVEDEWIEWPKESAPSDSLGLKHGFLDEDEFRKLIRDIALQDTLNLKINYGSPPIYTDTEYIMWDYDGEPIPFLGKGK